MYVLPYVLVLSMRFAAPPEQCWKLALLHAVLGHTCSLQKFPHRTYPWLGSFSPDCFSYLAVKWVSLHSCMVCAEETEFSIAGVESIRDLGLNVGSLRKQCGLFAPLPLSCRQEAGGLLLAPSRPRKASSSKERAR